MSTASGLWPGSPVASAKRDTIGTLSSQNVQMPSAGPVASSALSSLMAASALLNTDSASIPMSTGMNFAITCSSTSDFAHESGVSMMTALTPILAALR